MQKYFHFPGNQYIPVIWMTIGWIGLFYSRSLLSIFYAGLGGFALINIFNAGYRKSLGKHIPSLCFIGIWLIYFISGLWSDNTSAWMNRLNINIPYLAILPGILCFRWTENMIRKVLQSFMIIAVTSVMITLLLYFNDSTYYHKLYKMGQVMPTPVLHVRYSYYLTAPLCVLWILFVQKRILTDRLSKWLILLYSALIIVFIHMLAVRTGLLVLYGSIISFTFYYSWTNKKFHFIILSFLGLGLMATIAYQFFPTVQEKISYVRWDLKQLKETGGQANYSDNLRISSIQNGLRLAQKYPLLGAGIGDLEDDMQKMYRVYQPGFPDEANYPPVNQMAHWLASFGIVGGILVMLLFFKPAFMHSQYKMAVFFLYLATVLTFLGEATIELQLGKCFFLMWLGLLINPLELSEE